jgi:hypothetical protein
VTALQAAAGTGQIIKGIVSPETVSCISRSGEIAVDNEAGDGEAIRVVDAPD